MHELFSNHLVAGVVGAALFTAALFAFGTAFNAVDKRLGTPFQFSGPAPSDEELMVALKDTLRRSRRRLFPPRVQGANQQRPRPTATLSDLEAAERAMNLQLPTLLRRLYLEVANGGFGPPYGLLGVGEDACDNNDVDISREYVGRRMPDPDDPAWQWPERVVPLISLGCGSYLCADLNFPNTPITEFDADIATDQQPTSTGFKPFYPSLKAFLQDWVAGKIVIPGWGLGASGA